MNAPLFFALPEYQALSEAICTQVGGEQGELQRKVFPDGERYQRVLTPVIGRHVVIVGGTFSDSATLAIYDLACAVVKHNAARLSMVVPYFGYSTMERAVKPGEVVVAKSRARLLSAIPPANSGNHVYLLDLHSEGIPHYFEGGVTANHVYAKPVLVDLMARLGGQDFVLGSTDTGRAKWVESLANDLGVDAAIILKRRISGSETQVAAVSAEVTDRTVVIYDDMIRTGGSLIGAGKTYRTAGCADLVAVCTHGVFPGEALKRVQDSGLFSTIVATDSHPRAIELESSGLHLVTVAGVFAEALSQVS